MLYTILYTQLWNNTFPSASSVISAQMRSIAVPCINKFLCFYGNCLITKRWWTICSETDRKVIFQLKLRWHVENLVLHSSNGMRWSLPVFARVKSMWSASCGNIGGMVQSDIGGRRPGDALRSLCSLDINVYQVLLTEPHWTAGYNRIAGQWDCFIMAATAQ